MLIGVVQTRPSSCMVDANLAAHQTWIKRAASRGADMLFFPELSLLGYEPKHAARLAIRADDSRLDALQMLSDAFRITVGVGAPTPSPAGMRISMLVFRPDSGRIVYSKQHLHPDEQPYFVAGQGQITLPAAENTVAPAICYESLLEEHCEQAVGLGATIYVASVAKSARGLAKADTHYPSIARRHAVAVWMANSVGPCDDFEAVGGSAVWSAEGALLARLGSTDEGALLFDTVTQAATAIAD